MGIEILETGEAHVYRPDREWLLAVRNGLLQYEELLALAAEYEARLAVLQVASTLRETPDVARMEDLVAALQGEWLEARGEL